jgi:hypothetical protein
MPSSPDPASFDHRHFLPDATLAEWATIEGYCDEHHFEPGQTLFVPGGQPRLLEERSLVFLHSGVVTLGLFDREDRFPLAAPAVLGRGVFFAGELLFYRGIEAAEACDALVLSTPSFRRLATEHPALAVPLLMEMGCEMALTLVTQVQGPRAGRPAVPPEAA